MTGYVEDSLNPELVEEKKAINGLWNEVRPLIKCLGIDLGKLARQGMDTKEILTALSSDIGESKDDESMLIATGCMKQNCKRL